MSTRLRSGPPLNSSTVITKLSKPVKNFLDLPGCQFTETQLTIAHGLKQEHWQRIGEVLRKAETGIQWWLGDWMVYGEHEYSEKYAQAVDVHDQTGVNVDTLRNYQWVSEHVTPVMRITSLPWSYHQLVAPLPAEEQAYWLNYARAKREAGDDYSFRDLKRDIERAERTKNFKLVSSILQKIWERIEDGCYTVESIQKCGECGKNIFDLDPEEIKLYMQQLVGSGKAEWHEQGGKKDDQRGSMPKLCMPAGSPYGSALNLGYRPQVEYGEDVEEHY